MCIKRHSKSLSRTKRELYQILEDFDRNKNGQLTKSILFSQCVYDMYAEV